jgi:hypothetical protein
VSKWGVCLHVSVPVLFAGLLPPFLVFAKSNYLSEQGWCFCQAQEAMYTLITKLSETSIRPSPSTGHFLKEWTYIVKELLVHSLVPGFPVTTNVLYVPVTALRQLKVGGCLQPVGPHGRYKIRSFLC